MDHERISPYESKHGDEELGRIPERYDEAKKARIAKQKQYGPFLQELFKCVTLSQLRKLEKELTTSEKNNEWIMQDLENALNEYNN